jgi:surfactin synthase thioesterase subunit
MTQAVLDHKVAGPARGGPFGSRAAGQWLLDIGADEALPPMLIFPHAGGGPAAYRHLAQRWNQRLHPFIVHLPGRESRMGEEPMRSMPSLIRALVPAVLPLLGSRFVLYGHSMGALVAFELARQARRCFGIEPDHLIISGYPAPRRIRHTGRHMLPDAELWESVCALGGLPPAIAADPEMRSLLMPVMRADFCLCETYSYVPDRPLTCPISAFGGVQDNEVRTSDIAAWADETTGDFRYELSIGGHFFNVKQPGEFADLVMRDLAVTLALAGPLGRRPSDADQRFTAGRRTAS